MQQNAKCGSWHLKGLESELSHVNVLFSFQGYSDIEESTFHYKNGDFDI